MLNKWAPDMSEHIRRPPFNLRLSLCLFAGAFLPAAVTFRGNQVASRSPLAGILLSGSLLVRSLLVGPLELARGNKPNDHGPHDDDPVRVGKPLMLNEVAAQRIAQSRRG